ncbi:MAG: AAA family ATPase, partial [Candidatus Altarchaeum sp.]|nr:AAA family ATPase [Candidatus Altarchaeum sp.]
NNTGKSNIIDVLSFLNDGAKESEKIFSKRGGYKEVVFGGDMTNNIEINAVFEGEFYKDMFLFNYYLKFPLEKNALYPVEEKLEIQKNNGERERFPKPSAAARPTLYWFRHNGAYNLHLITEKSKIEETKKKVEEAERATMQEYKLGINGAFFYTLLMKICSYKIIPHNIKPEYPQVFVEENMELDNDCKNLALFLLKLSQQNKKTFERITELLCGVVNEIEDISPQVLGKNVYLMIKDKNFDKFFYTESVSDGVISLLSYITIIETADKHNIICFEEPENYIHARILEFIVDLMKKSNAQIIVTTHSLSFIDLCNPEDIIIVEKEKGETKARKIENREELKKFLEENELTLGELYYSSELKNE